MLHDSKAQFQLWKSQIDLKSNRQPNKAGKREYRGDSNKIIYSMKASLSKRSTLVDDTHSSLHNTILGRAKDIPHPCRPSAVHAPQQWQCGRPTTRGLDGRDSGTRASREDVHGDVDVGSDGGR